MVSSLLSPQEKSQIAHELRQSIRELRDRGLLVSAKWYVSFYNRGRANSTNRASELLASLPRKYRSTPDLPFSPPPQPHLSQLTQSPPQGPRPSLGDFLPSPGPGDSSISISVAGPSRISRYTEEEDDILDEDEFQLARGYFDMKEFDRVVHVLRNAPGKRARFLRIYSAYLVSF
jgi:anaphase-promoting complex subunit 8